MAVAAANRFSWAAFVFWRRPRLIGAAGGEADGGSP
jgi:hypothetical protein